MDRRILLQKVEFSELINKLFSKTCKFMHKNENLIYKILLLLSLLSYFFYNYSYALIKGGRWDLNQHIAMADRLLDGKGFYYSASEASSPYFPGLGFLSVIVGLVFGDYRGYVLLALASLVGTLFLFVLIRISTALTGNKWISLVVVCYIMNRSFITYKFYMNEFKADTLIYLFGFLLVLTINRYSNDKAYYKQFIILFILSFIMDITKQQALYIDVALGVYIVFTKRFKLNEKIKILIPMLLAGLLDLVVLFSISGMRLLTIDNLKNMPYFGTYHIVHEILNVYDEQKWVVLLSLVVIIIVLILRKKIEVDSLFYMWLLIAICVLAGQIAGGMKIGGNKGNYEAGLVLFVPFVPIAYDYLIKTFIKIDKRQLLYVVLVYWIYICRCFDLDDISSIVNHNYGSTETERYLNEHYCGIECIYDSDHYMMIKNSGLIPAVDIYTIPIFCEEYYSYTADLINERKYSVIIVYSSDLKMFDDQTEKYFGYNPHSFEALEENYVLVEDSEMPAQLVGRIFVLSKGETD